MAKKKETNNQEKVTLNIKGMKLANVRRLSKEVVVFSLLGNGLGLYNLRVVNGQKGKFIAAPQSKGKDGNYYGQYAIYLSDEDQERIIKAVLEKAPDPEPADDDGGDAEF